MEVQKEYKKRFMKRFDSRTSQSIADLEGCGYDKSNENSDLDGKVETLPLDFTSSKFIDNKEDPDSSAFLTTFVEVENQRKIATLANYAFRFAITNGVRHLALKIMTTHMPS